jgi:hypothetical protein
MCGGTGNGPSTITGNTGDDIAWTNGKQVMYGYPTKEYGWEFTPLQGIAGHPAQSQGGFAGIGFSKLDLPICSPLPPLHVCAECGGKAWRDDYLCESCREAA